MSYKIQIAVAVVVALAIVYLVNLIRKRKVELKHTLLWFLLSFVILILDIFPELISWIARLLGVGVPINMLFFMGFLFLLIIVFSLTLMASRMSNRIKVLTQKVGLLEEALRESKTHLDEEEITQ